MLAGRFFLGRHRVVSPAQGAGVGVESFVSLGGNEAAFADRFRGAIRALNFVWMKRLVGEQQ